MELNNVSIDILDHPIKDFRRQVRNWTETVETLDLTNPILVRMLNDQMMEVEKAFLTPFGLPLQNSTNHVLFSARGSSHHGKVNFPGIINLLEEFDNLPTDDERQGWTEGWEKLRRHVTEIYVFIKQASSILKPHHIV